MKALLILITLLTATTHCWAEENHEVPALSEDEVIWETEQIGGINDVLVSPLGEIFYNVTGSTIQIRSIEDGTLIDYFIPDDMPNHITHISITNDGRYMAMSGDNPHIVIYDLVLEREVKRLTTNVFEREEYGKLKTYKTKQWLSSSISPDGARVTGIAEGDQATSSQCWVVIDIETEEELKKETRLGYDVFNPEKLEISEWISSEFTPDGDYIVSQINWGGGGQKEPDSIYIHDANTLEVYDVVLNSYHASNEHFKIHPNKSFFTFFNKERTKINTYDILNKKESPTNIITDPFALVFLRFSDHVIYGFGFENHIYNLNSNKVVYEYLNPKVPKTITLNDKYLLSTLDNRIYCMNIFLNETSVEDNKNTETAISPNPTNGVVHFSLDCTEPELVYSIYSSVGAVLASDIKVKQSGDVSIDFSTYPNGVYFVSFLCNGELKTYKIVKEG